MEKIFITEKQLEYFIFNSKKEKLIDKNLILDYYKIKRQLKIGNYGIADLISIERPLYYKESKILKGVHFKGCINIYELKKDIIDINALMQASRYLKGIKRYLERRGFDINKFDFRITLIGSEININSDFVYLLDSLSNPLYEFSESEFGGELSDIYVYTYEMTIDGLMFKNESFSYFLTNEGF